MVSPQDVREKAYPKDKSAGEGKKILTRLVTRPASFYVAAWCINRGISANKITVLNTGNGILACLLFLFGRPGYFVISSALLIFWAILECVDGNIARFTGESSNLGAFLDDLNLYLMNSLFGICIGIGVYRSGGILHHLFEGNEALLIILGSSLSISVLLQRWIISKTPVRGRGLERGAETQEPGMSLRSFVKFIFYLIYKGALKFYILALTALLGAVDLFLVAYLGMSIITVCRFIYTAVRRLHET